MKHQSARTMAFTALVLAVAAVAWADGGRRCSDARVAGDWGYTKTGTLFLPTGAAVPFATMGTLTLEADGTLSGVNTGSVNGAVSNDLLSGTFQINSDCTGTATIEVYDQAGTLLRTDRHGSRRRRQLEGTARAGDVAGAPERREPAVGDHRPGEARVLRWVG